jgi:hypothetical protein
MKKLSIIILSFGLSILSTRSGYSQSSHLFEIIDSLTVKDLNYNIDTNLTNVKKPYPLIILDGIIVNREKLSRLQMEDIKVIKSIPKSDSLAFQLFDNNGWGGFIIIETNLSKRKLNKKL